MSYTPIKDIEIFIFKALISVGTLLGRMAFVNICFFVAPRDFNRVM